MQQRERSEEHDRERRRIMTPPHERRENERAPPETDDGQPRPGQAEKARGFATETIGRESRGGFAVQVQAQRIREREPATRRPRRKLNAPCARDAVHSKQENGEDVIQSEQSPSG